MSIHQNVNGAETGGAKMIALSLDSHFFRHAKIMCIRCGEDKKIDTFDVNKKIGFTIRSCQTFSVGCSFVHFTIIIIIHCREILISLSCCNALCIAHMLVCADK